MDVSVEKKFRELWEATGLTMDDFALLLGEKAQRIKDILRGKTKFPSDMMLKIQDKVPVNIQWFFGGEDEPMFIGEPNFQQMKSRLAKGTRSDADPEIPSVARETMAAYNIDPDSFVFIRHYDVRGSMGEGVVNDHEKVKQWNAYRRTFWQREIGLPPDECFSTDLTGTSMVPFLTERHVPVWHRENRADIDATYFFRYQDRNYVKRLQYVPGKGLTVRSEDPSEETWVIPDDGEDKEFKVIGRLVFKQLGEKV